MFSNYVYEQSAAAYTDRIILIDADHLEPTMNYSACFRDEGFRMIRYLDDLSFRISEERAWKSDEGKLAILADPDQYIPYDILQRGKTYYVTKKILFPRLNTTVIVREKPVDYELLSIAYQSDFEKHNTARATEQFLKTQVYDRKNVKRYMEESLKGLLETAKRSTSYAEWFSIAEKKAQLDRMAVEYDLPADTTELNTLFRDYILSAYGKLSACLDSTGPVLVSRAMEYMADRSRRFVIIVMDGMSEFDWNILSESFNGIRYTKTSAFAMIPTVTSVSRQCLLSGKLPGKLANPWSQSKEKQEFTECALRMDFTDKQISYQRGYDADFGSLIRCGAVIINDIDDMVHGQKQGRIGMFNDVGVMAKEGKLSLLARRLLKAGFDVFITADHGNTLRCGLGRLMGTGVETETKSHCMLVLKGYADKNGLKEKHGLIEFPKTYLPKEFDYLICDVGDSFDIKGEKVMTHGGISLDECVVPFIRIKAEENHG